MLVYLFRHGRAQEQAASDAQRELTEEGRAQVDSIISQLQQQQPAIDQVLCSPYIRARQTADTLAESLGGVPVSEFSGLLPQTSAPDLLRQLAELSGTATALVGHNPLLSQLLSLMVDGQIDSGRSLGTANFAAIECEVPAAGCGELMYLLQPESPD